MVYRGRFDIDKAIVRLILRVELLVYVLSV